jgi:hypothetical protein
MRTTRLKAPSKKSCGLILGRMANVPVRLSCYSDDRRFDQRGTIGRVKDWEIIADNLSKAEWSWDWVSRGF